MEHAVIPAEIIGLSPKYFVTALGVLTAVNPEVAFQFII
jgi:hypothetical protein